jgi:hypothetical protein
MSTAINLAVFIREAKNVAGAKASTFEDIAKLRRQVAANCMVNGCERLQLLYQPTMNTDLRVMARRNAVCEEDPWCQKVNT